MFPTRLRSKPRCSFVKVQRVVGASSRPWFDPSLSLRGSASNTTYDVTVLKTTHGFSTIPKNMSMKIQMQIGQLGEIIWHMERVRLIRAKERRHFLWQ